MIEGFGHENIQATHPSTVEFTKDTHLSKNGDCILVVSANKGLADFQQKFKETLRKPNAQLTIRIQVGSIIEEIHAKGSPHLDLCHEKEMVVRKSEYVSERTLGILADKAANDLSRGLVEALKNPKKRATITLTVQG